MKKIIAGLAFLSVLMIAPSLVLQAQDSPDSTEVTEQLLQPSDKSQAHEAAEGETVQEKASEHHAKDPAGWSVIPFILLLAMIATGPLFYPRFWHKYYPLVAAFLGFLVVIYYLFVLTDVHHPLHSLQEYVSFIALLTALFVASGGIMIKVDRAGTPLVNVALLLFGAIIANIIGTTGASMLLIRPYMKLNKGRIKPFHIVFFIFIVSNVGGSLTPIGDPPLFLGFLQGVPFFWTVTHLFAKWVFGISLLLLIFYVMDKRKAARADKEENIPEYTGKIQIKGLPNMIFLLITIGAVFLDPNLEEWVPGLTWQGIHFSYVREAIMFAAAFFAFRLSSKEALQYNDFNFEPILEVAYLFLGIFATMMPALQLIAEFANSPSGQELVNVHSLYFATGTLSSVLDNAPTYLNFLAAGMGKEGLDFATQAHEFAANYGTELAAISIGAVFFGANTYIGNAPNFMVKSIAEQAGVEMPSFMGYVIRYSIPILMPVLVLTWLVFWVLL